jgi:hypothetical protein
MVTALLCLSIIVFVYAMYLTSIVNKKQKNKELDKGMNLNSVKHPFIANPMLIAYVVTPILVVIGAIIWLMLMES